MKNQYLSYDEAAAQFQSLARKHPDLIKTESIGRTWEGREILLVTVTPDVGSAEGKPALFYTGCAHAREWIGIELAAAFVRHVVANIDLDAELAAILDRTTLYLVPCLNPDGFELSRNHFSLWRKNLRDNGDGTRGVDLNRNFPIGFKTNTQTNSNLYPGPEPFSEPETRAIRDFVENHANIAVALDYHSHGNVFFPAHNFRHEDCPDTTDMNVFCANMAEEIRKVSGREYGIHQGKPPGSMISGSGREYYNSRGILSTVVEVGSRNISDYLANMAENIREHIPALIRALRDVPNYARDNPLPRVDGFQIEWIRAREVTLSWEPVPGERISYELFRGRRDKHHCLPNNRIVVTRANRYTDRNLETASDYFYYLRAVDGANRRKSSFSPRIALKTLPASHEFFKILYPAPDRVGSLSEKPGPHPLVFGVNSMFVGVSRSRGVCTGLMGFSLETLPREALVLEAKVSLYPINRVPAKVERYGEWNVGIIDPDQSPDIADAEAVRRAPVLQYVGRPTRSQHLTQGIWRSWRFSNYECRLLGRQIQHGQVLFKVTGPTTLPLGRESQMMMWDVGHGKYGFGLAFRPKLEIIYTLPPRETRLTPCRVVGVHDGGSLPDRIPVGFHQRRESCGYLEFDLEGVTDIGDTVLIAASLELRADTVVDDDGLRFHVEFTKPLTDVTPDSIQNRETIEQIDRDFGPEDLKKEEPVLLVFDTFSQIRLDTIFRENRKAAFLLRASRATPSGEDRVVDFNNDADGFQPRLVVHHLPKRRKPVAPVRNLKVHADQNTLRLTWDNPSDPAFRGVVVVKNPFRAPFSPFDGQKLYGGPDNYTFDRFGARDMTKFYGVFTYDDVPNFSEATWIRYR